MNKIGRIYFLVGVICVFLTILFTPVFAQAIAINSDAAVLIDAVSGRVLWQKNAETPLPPASTTKILTAVTAIDLSDCDQVCQISPLAAAVGESSIHLQAGECLTLLDLLQGALIRSGNDASYAIGEAVAGTEPLFVSLMNLKAQALGAKTVQFNNTNGLPSEGHVVSALDLALIARYGMTKDVFTDIVKKRTATIGEGSSRRTIKSTNKLLWQSDSITGIKTGTTDDAGACLVASMERDGIKLISVVFNSPSRYDESLRLLNYGMDNYSSIQTVKKGDIIAAVPVLNGESKYVRLVTANEGYTLCSKEEIDGLQVEWNFKQNLKAPIKKEEPLGVMIVKNTKEEVIQKIDLLAVNEVKSNDIFGVWADKIKDFLFGYRND